MRVLTAGKPARCDAFGTTAARHTAAQTRFASLLSLPKLCDAPPAARVKQSQECPGPAAATASCQKGKRPARTMAQVLNPRAPPQSLLRAVQEGHGPTPWSRRPRPPQRLLRKAGLATADAKQSRAAGAGRAGLAVGGRPGHLCVARWGWPSSGMYIGGLGSSNGRIVSFLASLNGCAGFRRQKKAVRAHKARTTEKFRRWSRCTSWHRRRRAMGGPIDALPFSNKFATQSIGSLLVLTPVILKGWRHVSSWFLAFALVQIAEGCCVRRSYKTCRLWSRLVRGVPASSRRWRRGSRRHPEIDARRSAPRCTSSANLILWCRRVPIARCSSC